MKVVCIDVPSLMPCRYDLFFDASYIQWLQQNHPSGLPNYNCEDEWSYRDEDGFDFLCNRSDPFDPFEAGPVVHQRPPPCSVSPNISVPVSSDFSESVVALLLRLPLLVLLLPTFLLH